MSLTGNCPVCEAEVYPESDVEESEILACQDCHSSLVVETVAGARVILDEAPQIEEDWGE